MEEYKHRPSPSNNVSGSRWRVFEDNTPGYWGIEFEDASNDADAIMSPIKIHRDTATSIVESHNATFPPTTAELSVVLAKSLAALRHARDQIQHPDQMIDEAITLAEALASAEVEGPVTITPEDGENNE